MRRDLRCSIQLQPIEWVKGKVIGSGSFGTVHLAMDQANGSLFVVKCATSEAGIMSLKNEANILGSLDSPYIIKNLGKDFRLTKNGEKKYSLFVEYMPGGSLSDVAEKFGGTLVERVIILYTRAILKGLKYLHQNGIVHSDLKCKNVLLGLSGDIKLADFGSAKRVNDRLNSCSWIGGTPLWMAPEVLRNEGFDFAADIWSLGCTVIEMATGKAPWDVHPSNQMAQIFSIARGDKVPQFPRKFSHEGMDFLAKCLQTDTAKRWTSEELLNHPFIVRKECAFSPSSVLDVVSYDSAGDSSDDEFTFSENHENMMPKDELETDFESPDNWITVRTR